MKLKKLPNKQSAMRCINENPKGVTCIISKVEKQKSKKKAQRSQLIKLQFKIQVF